MLHQGQYLAPLQESWSLGLINMKLKNDGYTLVELLLYIAIIGILLGALSAFFGTVVTSRAKNQTIAEVNQQGEFALQTIARTVRNADSITLPATAGTGSTLTLAVTPAASSPTIFTLTSGAVTMQEGVAAAIPLTGGKVTVTAFTVKNLSRASTPGVVQISITMNRVNAQGTNEYDYPRTFTTTAAVRQ
jgi:type II secretory pathway pseudopilin PulG